MSKDYTCLLLLFVKSCDTIILFALMNVQACVRNKLFMQAKSCY